MQPRVVQLLDADKDGVAGNRGEYACRDRYHDGGSESDQPRPGEKLLLGAPFCAASPLILGTGHRARTGQGPRCGVCSRRALAYDELLAGQVCGCLREVAGVGMNHG